MDVVTGSALAQTDQPQSVCIAAGILLSLAKIGKIVEGNLREASKVAWYDTLRTTDVVNCSQCHGLIETAEKWVNVFKLSGKFELNSKMDIPLKDLYLLAAPSTPDEARAKVIEQAGR